MATSAKNGKKILIIEDDDLLADAYKMRFNEDMGCNVKVVNSAKEAQEAVSSFQPNLIILDILMPEVDGFELLKKWSESGLVLNVPVIIASNLNNQESINKALSLGAKNYFVKSSILPEDLVSRCSDLLAGKKASPRTNKSGQN